MQATEEHTNAYQNGVNDRSKRRAAGPSRASVPGYQLHDRKDGLLPPAAQDLEERVRCLQEEDTPLGWRFCEGCACIDCGNTEENVAEVHKRRHKVNVKNPHAFQDKKNPIVAKGCNCLKSRCLKGYCECYAAARGCMPICCCKDCENVYGVRPGIDDQMLGHRRMPLFNYGTAVESEEEGSEQPGRCAPRPWTEFDLHPRAHIAHTSHAAPSNALNAAQAVRAGRPAASDSSEPPHQDLLNLVAAAEQLERDTGLDIPCADTHDVSGQQPASKKQRMELTVDAIAAQSGHLSQPLFKSAPTAKRSTAGAAARHSKAGPLEQNGRGSRAGPCVRATPHGEQSAIRNMHAKLIQHVNHRPEATKSLPEHAHDEGSPLDESTLLSPLRTGKGGATPHPVKLVQSPEGLHLTVVSAPTSGDRSSGGPAMDESNPGGSSNVAGMREGIMSRAVAGRLSVTATNVQTLQASEIPLEGTAAECQNPAREGPENEELRGVLSLPSAQENNAFGAVQNASLTVRETIAAIGTQGGVNLEPKGVQSTAPVQQEAQCAPIGMSEQAETAELKVERRSSLPEATRVMDDVAAHKMKALLVTMLPSKEGDDSELYCSIPVTLPSDDGTANAPLQTTLLVPCSQVLAGARIGQQQVRVRLQSVDLAAHDLELLCKSADAANEGAVPEHSTERTHSGAENIKRHQLNVSALKSLGTGDNSSQHSGDVSPWGPGNPTIAPDEPGHLQENPGQAHATARAATDGPDDVRSKDMDCQDAADKDERRFRSARLQKRAAREGPRLTQVGFDDTVLASTKRRRIVTDAHTPTAARPDVLSGIIGKRVVVPRRSRTTVPSTQAPSTAMPPPGTSSAHEQEQSAQPQQPANSHCPNVRTKSMAVCAGVPSPAQVDEERHAVMGLLSLCKAS